MTRRRQDAPPALYGVWGVWALYGLIVAAVFATYARLPVQDLYHVSANGRTGGLSRALVVLNFPVALAAIALVTIVAARARQRHITILTAVAVVLCAAVAWPGIVDQADLDAKWANAVAAVGVGLAFVVTVVVTRRHGMGSRMRLRGDGVRVVSILVITFVSVPFIAAELGFLVRDGWPVLGSIFYSDEWFGPFGHARLHRAVHEGHHHGIDGALLAVTAIVLSRSLGQVPSRLRGVLGGYLALMLVYGLANFAQDVSYEQFVKRGVTGIQIPPLLVPSVGWPWLAVVLITAIVYVVLFRRVEPGEAVAGRALRWPALWFAAIAVLVTVGLTQGGEHRTTAFRSVEGVAYVYAPERRSHIFLTLHGDDAQLTDSDASELAPDWSRDGMLAFQSNRDGDWDVYVRRRDGAVRQLTDDDGAEGEPAWSPDAARVAFVSDGDAYVVTSSGERERKVADDVNWPAWSLQGFFAFETGSHPRRRLAGFVDRRHRATDENADFRYPAWSPDGRRLAHGCRVDDHWQICIWDRASGLLDVVRSNFNDFAPAWSPDGTRIAFVSDRDGNDQIFVMRADGTEVVRVTSGQGDKDTPAWRP